MATTVRVVLNERGFHELAADPGMRDELVERADQGVVRGARQRAPKDTGYGASTIRAEPLLDGDQEWTVRVSWDQTAYYMRFHELGTRHMPPRPFLSTVEGL